MYLDYSLKTTEERIAHVADILAEQTEPLSTKYKQYLADYILFYTEKEQTKLEKNRDYPITTRNREITIDKRQISYEQVVNSLENGEDGIYALIKEDKNQFLDQKKSITDNDIKKIPQIKVLLDQIDNLKTQFDKAVGFRKYNLKKQIIETYQQIYILKASITESTGRKSSQIKTMAHMNIPEKIVLDKNQMPHAKSPLSLLNPQHVSFLLCYYSQLKQECWDDLDCDMHWLLIDLENLVEQTLREYPVLYAILIFKIDGLSNEEIQQKMEVDYNIIHNEQYYSTLWRKRIPKLLSEQAKKNYLNWYFFNEEKGQWKYCATCGTYKLAHPMFFSHNTSKDSWYSVCKDCRKKKNR